MVSAATMEYHFIATRMAMIKNTDKRCQGCGDESLRRLPVGMQTGVTILSESWGAPQKGKHRAIFMIQ